MEKGLTVNRILVEGGRIDRGMVFVSGDKWGVIKSIRLLDELNSPIISHSNQQSQIIYQSQLKKDLNEKDKVKCEIFEKDRRGAGRVIEILTSTVLNSGNRLIICKNEENAKKIAEEERDRQIYMEREREDYMIQSNRKSTKNMKYLHRILREREELFYPYLSIPSYLSIDEDALSVH
jgi:hypothetical protein